MGLTGNVVGAYEFTPLAVLNLVFIKRRPQDLLDFDKFGNAIFTLLWTRFGNITRPNEQKKLEDFFNQAHGVVLDLGPGAGFTVKHFDRTHITKIFGIEPNLDFHPQLHANIAAAGLSDIYTVVPCGVEDFHTLAKFGITEDSIDTVVACKVLCSVPRPWDMCKALYKLLAPGGQLIASEHVRSSNGIATFLQDTINHVWRFFFAGCNINRPTYTYLLEAGDWETKQIKKPEGSYDEAVLPFIDAKFVKPA